MEINDLFQEDWVAFHYELNTINDLFKIVSNDLINKNLVNNNYLHGITEREKEFPTGLITQYLNIALPHSDPQYIKHPFVYIVKLQKPIIFKQMGDNQEMEVQDLFFLGIKDIKHQVGLLANIMALFMNEKFVNQYKQETNSESIIKLIKKSL